MKKVLIFSLAYYPHVGGAEVAVKEITDRISDIEFHMVTLRFSAADTQHEKIGNVFVHRVGFGKNYLSKILFVPFAALKAFRLHHTRRFDGFWAMMSYMAFPISLMRLVGNRTPYVLTLQDGDPFVRVFERPQIKLVSLILRHGFRHATVVQTISHFLAQWPKSLGYKGQVEVVPNGVDIKKFKGNPIEHEGTVLITTSRLVHKNAVDVVIRALVHLPNVRFQILGIGPDEEKLRALAHEMKVSDRVEFVGHIDHKDMPAYLHKADIFIRPSRSEGQGASFVEAMGAGLPVIATQEGGLVDFISDKTAWPVRADHPEDIVAAVNKILSNPDATQKVVETAGQMVEEKYDWDLIAKNMRGKVFERVFK